MEEERCSKVLARITNLTNRFKKARLDVCGNNKRLARITNLRNRCKGVMGKFSIKLTMPSSKK
jgi:hypothetical protein